MSQSAKQFVAELRTRFERSASGENAAAMKAYMRGQFDFFGIKSTERRDLLREQVSENGLPEIAQLRTVVSLLWREPNREMQHSAMELLHRRVKELSLEDLPLLEAMITTKSWWDTVDFISYKLVGQILIRHPRKQSAIARRMANSGHLWLIRVSIIFQLLRREGTARTLLATMIRKQAEYPDFFIRKAIGWALRDYAKTDPDWVRRFVKKTALSPLSKREALKNL